ncbi:hypothetical protein [Halopseudomonas pertucinogena]|uniref:hypothetical protein n=1 Tax=Halopseudomonas pertucinogena TaxID=86175 RepID=UPI0016697DC1|nr:hypothetical protein [Halopseudomonas pertucinogena]
MKIIRCFFLWIKIFFISSLGSMVAFVVADSIRVVSIGGAVGLNLKERFHDSLQLGAILTFCACIIVVIGFLRDDV